MLIPKNSSYVGMELRRLHDTIDSFCNVKPDTPIVYQKSKDGIAGTFLKTQQQAENILGLQESPSLQKKEDSPQTLRERATNFEYPQNELVQITNPAEAFCDINDRFQRTLEHFDERVNRLRVDQQKFCEEELAYIEKHIDDVGNLLRNLDENVTSNAQFQTQIQRFNAICLKSFPKHQIANDFGTLNLEDYVSQEIKWNERLSLLENLETKVGQFAYDILKGINDYSKIMYGEKY